MSLRIVAMSIALFAAACGGGHSSNHAPTTIGAYVKATQTYSPEQCHPIKVKNPLYSEMDGYQCVSTGPASRPITHLKGVPGPVPTVTYWLHVKGTPFEAKTVLDATWLARV